MTPKVVIIAAALCVTLLLSVASIYVLATPTYISPIASEAFAQELDKRPKPTATPTSTPTPIPTATPTPTALPTATPTPLPIVVSGDLESFFSKYSSEYGVDKELLKRIADCESHFNAGAVNGEYGGMYQFSASSWSSTRSHMGQDGNPDLRFHAEESIKTAAFKISKNGTSAWPSCD